MHIYVYIYMHSCVYRCVGRCRAHLGHLLRELLQGSEQLLRLDAQLPASVNVRRKRSGSAKPWPPFKGNMGVSFLRVPEFFWFYREPKKDNHIQPPFFRGSRKKDTAAELFLQIGHPMLGLFRDVFLGGRFWNRELWLREVLRGTPKPTLFFEGLLSF